MEPFPGEISTAHRSTAGAPTGFIGITRDITEQKQAVESGKAPGAASKRNFRWGSHEFGHTAQLDGYLEQYVMEPGSTKIYLMR